MKRLLLLNEEKYVFKSGEYGINEVDKLRKKLGKSINIILLNNNIFIQCFKDVNINEEKYIEEQYISRIAFNANTLIHYDYLKKHKALYIYSINDVGSISNLIPDIVNLKIVPIQFIIYKYVRKKIKNILFFTIIALIKDNIHIIQCENGVIISCEILALEEFVEQNIFYGKYNDKQIVADKEIINFIPKTKNKREGITILDIGGYLNDKVFKI
jgi:hypothetical protein